MNNAAAASPLLLFFLNLDMRTSRIPGSLALRKKDGERGNILVVDCSTLQHLSSCAVRIIEGVEEGGYRTWVAQH